MAFAGDRGVDITAFDCDVGAAARAAGVSAAPWTQVLRGGPEAVGAFEGHALLLLYPDDLEGHEEEGEEDDEGEDEGGEEEDEEEDDETSVVIDGRRHRGAAEGRPRGGRCRGGWFCHGGWFFAMVDGFAVMDGCAVVDGFAALDGFAN